MKSEIEKLFHKCLDLEKSRWDSVIQHLPESEQEEIKRLLDSDRDLKSNEDFLVFQTDQSIESTGNIQVGDSTASFNNSSSPSTLPPNSSPDAELRKQIGEYQILNVIAIHGQGVVYRANHPVLNRQVVIKVSKHELEAAAKDVLVREGQALASLSHPNLAQVFDLQFDDEQRPYLVMEFIEGRNLAEILKTRSFDETEVLELFHKLLPAISHAHSHGIVHRDLKPANIVIRATDDEPKIIDFGLALTRNPYSGEDKDKTYGGTINYMSPEQATALLTRGSNDTTNDKSDIFSLGAILFELVTGEKIYKFKDGKVDLLIVVDCEIDFSKVDNANVSKQVKSACKRALNKDPTLRFQSAQEFIRALAPVESKTSVAAKRFDWRPVAIACVLLLLGFLGWGAYQNWFGRQNESQKSSQQGNVEEPLQSVLTGCEFEHRSLATGEILEGQLFRNGSIRFNDEMRMDLKFEEECFCYFFAVNPDSTIQLCFPEDQPDLVQTERVKSITYPEDPKYGFAFTDGVGQMAFIIVESTTPLPSFSDWLVTNQDRIKEAVAQSKGSWVWDENQFYEIKRKSALTLRAKRKLTDATPLGKELKGIEASNQGMNIRAVTFPVVR